MALSHQHLERLDLLLERGRLAFELGLYLDAAAAWEVAWRQEFGPARQLLQGLIQAAGAYHKRRLEQPLGMVKLLAFALERLDPIPDGFGGLRLDAFREGLERSRREAVAWATGGPAPGPVASLLRAFEP
jgi:predicted metal-dependent hydrolase